MIDQLTVVTKAEDVKTLQKVLDNIHQQAVGYVTYNTTVISLAMVPTGKMAVVDDGTTKRIYFKTGANNLGYITLT